MDIGLGIIQASQQKSAGEIANIESKVEAKQIETAAAAREADRKERLARAVSSQSAAAGASGIAFEGSPLAVLEEDIRREKEATERDVLMSRVGQQAARARGKVAKSQARGAAIMTLLQTGAQMASLAPSGGSTSMKPITTGYGSPGRAASPSYGGTGGGRRFSKGT